MSRSHDREPQDAPEQIEELTHAIESRTIIGQAIGVTMERLGLTSQAAFDVLSVRASGSESKLRDVAAEVVTEANTRALALREQRRVRLAAELATERLLRDEGMGPDDSGHA